MSDDYKIIKYTNVIIFLAEYRKIKCRTDLVKDILLLKDRTSI